MSGRAPNPVRGRIEKWTRMKILSETSGSSRPNNDAMILSGRGLENEKIKHKNKVKLLDRENSNTFENSVRISNLGP